MLPVDEAVSRVLTTVRAVGVETVDVASALGRVLARDVVSSVDVPPWDTSAMDGYAVRAADAAPGASLTLQPPIAAGRLATVAVAAGLAAPIATGAPMPDGADAVVIVEDTDAARTGEVSLRAGAEPGAWVRRRGADLRTGQTVLTAGATLNAAQLGLLGSIGLTKVAVARRARVAILITGDEVAKPGDARTPGQLWSSNHLVLAGLVEAAGAVVAEVGFVGDDLEATVSALRSIGDVDVVLTTGGVSVGARDVTRDALERVGVSREFYKVRMQPGKPLAFGLWSRPSGEVAVFGLPGNPVSCAVVFVTMVRPWLRAAMGAARPHLPIVFATAGEALRSGPGRARFERVRLTDGPTGRVAWATGDRSSGVLSSLARADGLMVLGPDTPGPQPGEPVRVLLLAGEAERVDYGW